MKPISTNKIKAVGLMSGTSLDGLDLAAVEFWQTDAKWEFEIISARTISYSSNWTNKLSNAPTLSGDKLIELHTKYGRFLGTETKRFINETGFQPDLIASHGHTVFHQPESGFTFQVGNGADIAAIAGITTISDFRTSDVALGGQGAPLVPVGDKLLFSDYKYCLNLGGFANISYEENSRRIAFDICPVNLILNHFAEKQGFQFDKNGELGKSGKLEIKLLEKLNQIDFYQEQPPKSLAREWVEQVFMPVINNSEISDNDKLRTVYEHIARQITRISTGSGKMLVTGGGAFNSFLIERIKSLTNVEIVIPSNEIVNFKEALIFAFLGVLKICGHNNCLSSVTGAKHDHSSGVVYQV
ncbi:MAG TPA: anhydro-N-acetylmuramic acid kinase [Draconibacterium sp.]|nr:anhydro-N-acetylmuramic acid kinase [Draconibacterium sp.]